MNAVTAWQTAKNVLCIRLDHLGDVLMATPALRALKESVSGRRITLLAAPHGTAAAPFIPEIDNAIGYAAPWMKSSEVHGPAADFAMIAQLRRQRFDAAVIFTTYSQSPLPAALLCQLAGIPLRLAHCRENPYQLLSDWLPDPEPQEMVRHEVRRQLDLVAATGSSTRDERISFVVRPDDLAWARTRLAALDVDCSRRWLLLHPGGTAASRRYPPQNWAQVVAGLATQLDCPMLFTGSAAEAPLIDGIMQMARCQNPKAKLFTLAGQASLGQLGAVIALASLVLANNTGPVHVAAALAKPVVDLYALTNPQHTPWMTPSRVLFHDVPCRFCYKSVCPQGHHHCLTLVAPARVIAATLELLDCL